MCVKLMCTTQLQKFGSAIGTHSRQMSSASHDSAMETFPDESVVDSCFGASLDDFYNFSWQAAPICRSVYQVVNALTLKFVLSPKLRFVPVFWVVKEGGFRRGWSIRSTLSIPIIPIILILLLLILLLLLDLLGVPFEILAERQVVEGRIVNRKLVFVKHAISITDGNVRAY